jgi:hypothetical protein
MRLKTLCTASVAVLASVFLVAAAGKKEPDEIRVQHHVESWYRGRGQRQKRLPGPDVGGPYGRRRS